MQKALDKLDKITNGTSQFGGFSKNLIEILFYQRKPKVKGKGKGKEEGAGIKEYYNKNLNEIQKKAIEKCIETEEIGLIHGPPGTGKTTTVVELILQLVEKGEKVLACAPSNIAVDNLILSLDKFVDKKTQYPKMIRAGHPARMLPQVLQYSLENQIKNSKTSDGSYEIIEDVKKEIQSNIKSIHSLKTKSDRSKIYSELKFLRKELKQREKKLIREEIQSANVFLTTLTGCDSKYLELYEFSEQIQGYDTIIIDEAAQSIEVACWIAILLGKKLILAGDHLQLPPTIISQSACFSNQQKYISCSYTSSPFLSASLPSDPSHPDYQNDFKCPLGLDVTLFSRLMDKFKFDGMEDEFTTMLTIQYRMNELIMNWPSSALYENRLVAHPSVKDHLLSHLFSSPSTGERKSVPDTPVGPEEERVHGNEKKENDEETHEILKTAVCLIDTCSNLPEQMFTTSQPKQGGGSGEGENFKKKISETKSLLNVESKCNPGEAEIIKNIVVKLLDMGIKKKEIGIISPYNLQVDLLRSLLVDYFNPPSSSTTGTSNPILPALSNDPFDFMEIDSVDGFQGREKEVILISMVRSNVNNEIGFLSEKRRMNVAVTRARRFVVLIYDGETISSDSFLNGMVDFYINSPNTLYLTNSDYFYFLNQQNADSSNFTDNKMKYLKFQQMQQTKNSGSSPESPGTGKTPKKALEKEKGKQAVGEADNNMKNQLREQIDQFLNSEEASLTFPGSLSSGQRKFVHQCAEELNLFHKTVEIQSERVITIAKSAPAELSSNEEKNSSEGNHVIQTQVEAKKETQLNSNSKVTQQEVKAEAPALLTSAGFVTPAQPSTTKKKKNKNKKKKKGGNAGGGGYLCVEKDVEFSQGTWSANATKKSNDSFDALLAQFTKYSSHLLTSCFITIKLTQTSNRPENACKFGTCTRPVNVVTSQCKFCKEKFCANHGYSGTNALIFPYCYFKLKL